MLVPGAGAETLTDELGGLVKTHPNIASKSKTVKSFEEAERAARAGYLPTATVSGDTGPEYVDSPTRRSTEGRRFYKGRESATLSLSQKLFDGFDTEGRVDTAISQQGAAQADLRATRQTTFLEGVTAYLDVLKQTRLIALARENERKVSEQLSLEDERVRKGSGMASDVLAAKQRLQVAKERRVNYEGEFETSSSKYNQVFGHAPDVAAMVEPPLPMDLVPSTLEEALEIAQKENPNVQNAARKIDINSAKIKSSEAGYYPTVSLEGKSDYENDKNATIGVRRDMSLLLTAKWELFSGFKTDANVAQATWDHAASKDDHLQVSRKSQEQVRTAWHKLKTARQRIGLLENAANIAEEVWEAQKKKRDAGKATVQDVLDEETRINDARINYTIAFFDMYQSAYDLLVAMGRLEVENLQRAKPLAANPTLMPPALRKPIPSVVEEEPRKPAAAVAPAPAPIPAAAPVPAPAPVAATKVAPPPARAQAPAAPLPRLIATLPEAPSPAPAAAAPAAGLPDATPGAMIQRINQIMAPAKAEPAFAMPPSPAPVQVPPPLPTQALEKVSPQAMTTELKKRMAPAVPQPAYPPAMAAEPLPAIPGAPTDLPDGSPAAMVQRIGLMGR